MRFFIQLETQLHPFSHAQPTTQRTGLLSKALVQHKNSGWHRDYSEGGDNRLSPMKEYTPQRLLERKRWSDTVSRMRWTSTIIVYVACLISSDDVANDM